MTWLRTLPLRLLGLLVAALALTGPALAAGGTIRGTVVDQDELAVPGVLITLSSPSLIGGTQQRTSDGDGQFVFVELAPGDYEILAQKQGMGSVRKSGVQASLGRVTNVVIEMKIGGEAIDVVAEKPTVDTTKASSGQTFSKEYLSRIPTGRSYQQVVAATAGVAGGGNPSSGGASTNENQFVLDGANVTDPVTGTFSTNFTFNAIEEIEVITGGFDPEYGESLGAVISVVTKSGGNTLSFLANGFYLNGNFGPRTDARFSHDGFPLAPTGFDDTAETVQAGGQVGGPIVKDHIWFFGAYEYNRTLYSNVGVQLPRDFESHYFFGKLTAAPNEKHRLTLSFTTDPTTVDNIEQGDTTLLPESQGRQAQGGTITTLKWNWFINPEANLETLASFQKSTIVVSGVPCTHDLTLGYNACEPDELENTTDYTTPGRVGLFGAYDSVNYGFYYFDDRYRGQFSSKYSLLSVEDPLGGKHDLKAGVTVDYLGWNQVQGYSGDLIYYDLYENIANPETYTNYYWIETSGPSVYNSTGYHIGAFIQDVYKPIENLTFRYGLRYDRGVMRNDAGEPIIDVGSFGPRAYAIWDPWNDQKTKIYGGYGRFSEVGRLDVASYLSSSNLGQKLFVGEYFSNTDGSTATNNANDFNTENTITLFGNTIAPHSDEFTLGAQREVVTNLSVGAQFTGKFTRNVYSFDEANLIYDEDGYAILGGSTNTLNNLYRLRSPTIAQRDYYRVDVTVNRNFSQRWLVSGTYSYVSSYGRVQDSAGAALANPSQVELMYGELPYNYNHQGKLQVAWDLPNDPWTTKIGGAFEAFSGSPITRYYYSDANSFQSGGDTWALLKTPRGTYGEAPGYWDASILLQQEIPAVKKGKLAATLQVNNISNNQYGPSYYGYYVSANNRYVIAFRQDRVQAQLGALYEF